ncbi:hypothetical protein FG386_001700 [Cryptosporidium ryanae]|uniref:uncharacterized protein n=1 Tax=Cryptosporidium ryanae TaxID=515981 RepID=UPI003519F31C|nr:hypothetical protein FG386_001700 [Cryptosporidium ryanae]
MDFNDVYDEFGNYIGKDEDSEDNLSQFGEESGSDVSYDGNGESYGEFNALKHEGKHHIGDQYDDKSDISGESLSVLESRSDSDMRIDETMGDKESSGTKYLESDSNKAIYKEIKEKDFGNEIVLHEHKEYYPDASHVYGEDVEILVEEEDQQHIDTPLILPPKINNFDLVEKNLDRINTTFSPEFLRDLMNNFEFIRNMCVVGDLHYGKTTFIDTLIKSTHSYKDCTEASLKKAGSIRSKRRTKNFERYTDNRRDEQERGISIKSAPISLVMQNSQGKSYLLNIMDTPGHVNFVDEVCASIRISDGVMVFVDCIIGVTKHIERLVYHCLSEKKKMVLIVSQVDRFVLEARLPPYDCYFKINLIIESLNGTIKDYYNMYYCNNDNLELENTLFSPLKGNVGFSSGKYGFFFTINSFARMYLKKGGISNNSVLKEESKRFSDRLWGDIYFNHDKGTFETNNCDSSDRIDKRKRSFVQFVLEPIYKLIIYSVSEENNELGHFLKTVGIYLTKKEQLLNTKERLEVICRKFFGGPGSFVDFVIENIPNPKATAKEVADRYYTGPLNDYYSDCIREIRKDNCPCIIFIVKQYHSEDFEDFFSFGRVYSGRLKKGDKVMVLGESYSPEEDPDDFTYRIVNNIWVYQSRYKIEVNQASAGNWILISGLNNLVTNSATLVSYNYNSETGKKDSNIYNLSKIKYINNSVIKLAIEPHNPSELPKMLQGLKSINKTYNISKTKVEENGEHVIFGTGELHLDCIMHDLRCLYGNLDVKVSDPMVQFCETVMDSSVIKCYGESNNNLNKIYIVAEPLEKGIIDDLESGVIKIDSKFNLNKNTNERSYSSILMEKYGWDKLSVKSLWAFGPDNLSPSNVLIDDTISIKTDKKLLYDIKDDIIQGFNWSVREGPLLEEGVRNVKFKILDVNLALDKVSRGTGQIVPATRRACYTSMFLASPKIMEPIYLVEIICPSDIEEYINNVISKRRGYSGKEIPIPGSPLVTILAFIPAIELFGFETDLRIHTSGQAFCTSCFDHWAVVPGNPLDRNIVLKPLEKSPIPHLAREFLLKTRRRKGISDDVNIHNFITSPEIIKALNYEVA